MKERYEKVKEDIKPFNVMNIRTLIELNDIELERDAPKKGKIAPVLRSYGVEEVHNGLDQYYAYRPVREYKEGVRDGLIIYRLGLLWLQ